jgi:hypothetical protein
VKSTPGRLFEESRVVAHVSSLNQKEEVYLNVLNDAGTPDERRVTTCPYQPRPTKGAPDHGSGVHSGAGSHPYNAGSSSFATP